MFTCLNLELSNYNNLIFKNFSLSLFPGAIFILDGKNGTGKSSLLKLISGVIKPTEGEFFWKNRALEDHSQIISYLGHENALKENLSVIENLEFWSELKGTESLILPALAQFHLLKHIDTKCYELSAGIQRKVALARMIVYNTPLWLMDEPEANLDVDGRNQLLRLLQVKISNGGMAIIVTHHKDDYKNVPCINLEDFKYE